MDDDGEVRDVRVRRRQRLPARDHRRRGRHREGLPHLGRHGPRRIRALRALQPGATDREARRNVVEAIRQTADRLGNTPAVARRSYVHPAVLHAYLDGGIGDALVAAAEEQSAPPRGTSAEEEAGVVDLLRQRLELDAGRA